MDEEEKEARLLKFMQGAPVDAQTEDRGEAVFAIIMIILLLMVIGFILGLWE